MALLQQFDNANNTTDTTTSLPSAPQSPLCSGSERIDCLFATELGEFRVWHLILITVFVVVAALAVICKVIRCRRWPVAKKQGVLATDDIRLEEIESCDNREQQLPGDSATLEQIPPASTTDQRGASPRDSPHPLPHGGGVVTTDGVHDQLGAPDGYMPRPLEVQVEMSEVQHQPVQLQLIQHYQLSQPLYESSYLPPSVEEPMFLSLPQDDRHILSLPTTALYHPNLAGDEDGGTEEDNPRKSSFRKDAVKRHSYHFEKPHVSFRLDSDRTPQLGPPQPEAEDASALPYASHPLSLQYTEGVAPLPAPVPTYQWHGSYHGFPYIAPAGGRDQGRSRSRGADELEETESASAVLSATEV